MVLQPTWDNVVIKIQNQEAIQKTASGIILPKANGQEKQDQGEVVAIGPGRILNDGTFIKSSVSEGDKVIFNKFAGTEIQSGDDKYLIVKENDILAIIKE
jgi:chaperonin GroES